MTQKWVWTCLAAASVATFIASAPVGAYAQDRNLPPVPRAAQQNISNARSAAPLTISRSRVYATPSGYRYARPYYGYGYDNGYYNNGGWFPGLLAAPFLLTGALLGGAFGAGYDSYGYGYGPYYSKPVYYELGNFCATPQKVCQLYTPAEVGIGCSCRAGSGGGRFRGAVTL